MKPGDVAWPISVRKKWRTTVHYEDPVVERECPYCKKKHAWPLSETCKGQEKKCKCGATFCSWRSRAWVVG
jgi:hypothetical protein